MRTRNGRTGTGGSAARPVRRRSAWVRLIAFGFRLLYNELAWLYDPVSWIVSLGQWRAWQRTALVFLNAPEASRVLEVGFGPGHLLATLARAGYRPVGLDLSRAMLRLAGRRLRRARAPANLARGRAEALPFAAQAFDAVVLTFPTPFVYDPAWLDQVARVLKPGGRLVVVESAVLTRRGAVAQAIEWLYRITGQRGAAPDLPAMLGQAGLIAQRESATVDGSRAGLIVADKPSQ